MVSSSSIDAMHSPRKTGLIFITLVLQNGTAMGDNKRRRVCQNKAILGGKKRGHNRLPVIAALENNDGQRGRFGGGWQVIEMGQM